MLQQLALQVERAQRRVVRYVGREVVRAEQHHIAQIVQRTGDGNVDILGYRQIHFQLQLAQLYGILCLQHRRAQVAQLHLGRYEVVLRGQTVVEQSLGVVHHALRRSDRLLQYSVRLLGQQHVVECLTHVGHQIDARAACALDRRGHLRAVHLQLTVYRWYEQRQRYVAGCRQRIVGTERESLGHLLLDDRTRVLPRRVDLRVEVCKGLFAHIVVTLDLQVGHLYGGVVAERHLQRPIERQRKLGAGRRDGHGRSTQHHKKLLHS